MHFHIRIIHLIAAMFLSALTSLHADEEFLSQSPGAAASVKSSAEPFSAPSLPQGMTDSQHLQEALENLLAAIRSFDISKAYYAYTTRDFQKSISLEDFKQFVKKYSVLFRNKSITQETASFKEGFATYHGKLLSHDGEVYSVTVIFLSVDDEWKIQSISMREQLRGRPLR